MVRLTYLLFTLFLFLLPLLLSSFPFLFFVHSLVVVVAVAAVAVAVSFAIFFPPRHFSFLILFPYLLLLQSCCALV